MSTSSSESSFDLPAPKPPTKVAPIAVNLGLDVGTMNLVCARANMAGKI